MVNEVIHYVCSLTFFKIPLYGALKINAPQITKLQITVELQITNYKLLEGIDTNGSIRYTY